MSQYTRNVPPTFLRRPRSATPATPVTMEKKMRGRIVILRSRMKMVPRGPVTTLHVS